MVTALLNMQPADEAAWRRQALPVPAHQQRLHARTQRQAGDDDESQPHPAVLSRVRSRLADVTFLGDDFLLHSAAARRLYHDHAAPQPILDYHCHLPAGDLASDRRFDNLFEIWLEGDHYKWRAMRTAGVDERFCTGDADPYDKFLAWASTVPQTLRNPLYHWTHLELRRYFGITELLNPSTAPRIWARANECLRDGALTARGILAKFKVIALCTTDDPADSLDHHQTLRASGLRVFPTFRPDAALQVDAPAQFQGWIERLGTTAGVKIRTVTDLLEALSQRHHAFHLMGGRLSDHGLTHCYDAPCDETRANTIFREALDGHAASREDHERFASYLMRFFGQLDARQGWTKQLHLGARRNVNTRAAQTLGRDSGYDSIGDYPQVNALAAYLDALDREESLPRTVIYNSNPADNYAMATMIGNFQDGSMPGKVQFGSAWWFLDQKNGIEAQLNALSDAGLLSQFIGMVTDSRSFMSFPRHEYFRRVLCNRLGAEMESGELPDDFELVGRMVEAITFDNARRLLALPS
jgi:glucuronate isomerase